MSDATALTVPPAGWYPDRNDANTLRWWDGSQWTDHTHSIAPEQAVEQPVSAAAFGFAPVEPNPVAVVNVPTVAAAAATTGQAAPGWYPDNADRTIQRWWDGTQWTAHTAPAAVLPTPAPGGPLGPYAAPAAPVVNAIATRGMIYSLIALVLNPFLIMSIGGLVLGIRGLRRVPQFAPENARRGPAVAAIIVGSVATVLSILLVATAIAIPVYQAQHPQAHVFDRAGAERDLMTQLVPDDPARAPKRVSCPPDPAMKVGDTFDCTAYLVDGETLPVHITIDYDGRIWTYTWKADMSEASGNPDAGDANDGTVPTTIGQLEQTIARAVERDGVVVMHVDCPADAVVAPGAAFSCNAVLADGSTTIVDVNFPPEGGYGLGFTPPTPSAGSGDPGDPGDSGDPDLAHT